MSKLETNTIDTVSGTSTLQVGSTNTSTITLGVSGDTINVPSGVTINNNGTQTGFGGTNTPAFQVLLNSAQSISSGTNTVVAFDTEIFDTDNAVSSGVFTVPSGKAGKYFFTVNGGISTGSNVEYVNIWLSKNDQTTIATTSGWAIAVEYYHQGVAGTNNQIQCVSGTFDLAVGDSVKVYILQASGSSHNTSEKGRFTFSGHKLIT